MSVDRFVGPGTSVGVQGRAQLLSRADSALQRTAGHGPDKFFVVPARGNLSPAG